MTARIPFILRRTGAHRAPLQLHVVDSYVPRTGISSESARPSKLLLKQADLLLHCLLRRRRHFFNGSGRPGLLALRLWLLAFGPRLSWPRSGLRFGRTRCFHSNWNLRRRMGSLLFSLDSTLPWLL